MGQEGLAASQHVKVLVSSLNSEKSAEYLGVGVAMFYAIVAEGLLKPVKTETLKMPHYAKAGLDRLLASVEAAVVAKAENTSRGISLSHAAFTLRCPAGQILQFLTSGQLPSSYYERESAHLGQLRIMKSEVLEAIQRQDNADLTLEEARLKLGLDARQMRAIIGAGLLSTNVKKSYAQGRNPERVAQDDLEAFLACYVTPKVLAKWLKLPVRQVSARIKALKIQPDPAGNGARIYRREVIGQLRIARQGMVSVCRARSSGSM
ncbi:hypothetical protein [Thioclava sp. GXIMD4215]|uniref:hypothetical protein n=1 Tax=Thioclava sp. GXIMD4215 TaxID=3131928 RepID=UPI00311AE9D3